MNNKILNILFTLILAGQVTAQLPAYTCSLIQSEPAPFYDKYFYPGTIYQYDVVFSPDDFLDNYFEPKFIIKLTNGKFLDGDTVKTIEYTDILHNKIRVKWDDKIQPNSNMAVTGKISIDSVILHSGNIGKVTLKSKGAISAKIASLKGKVPVLSAGPDVGMGVNVNIIAITDVIPYTEDILDTISSFLIQRRKVTEYEWTLPQGWKAINGNTGTFYGDKEIRIIPDLFSTGTVSVRGANKPKTGFSEYATQTFNRGFSFTTYPTSITFGDINPKTFSVTAFSDVTYEWQVPDGWKINGQGSSLESYELNSVSITPSFCSVGGNSTVRVRLKNSQETAKSWLEHSINIPEHGISINPTTVYQFEEATVFPQNIDMGSVQSITFSGNGVQQGKGSNSDKVTFFQSGIVTLNVIILMQGCDTPFTYQKTITVKPHRLVITGPSTLCDPSEYTIEKISPATTVTWSMANNNFAITPMQTDKIVLSPKYYNVSDTLIAAIKYNGTVVQTLRQPVRSCEFYIQSECNAVSCKPRRFTVPLIAGASVLWEYASPIIVKGQRDNYIEVKMEGTTADNLWLSAVVTDSISGNIIASQTLNLANHNLKSANLKVIGRWRTKVDGVYRTQYGFEMETDPHDGGCRDYCFSWINEDLPKEPLQLPKSSALIQTGGSIGWAMPLCFEIGTAPDPGPWIRPGVLNSTLPENPMDPPVPYVPIDLPEYALVTLPDNYEGTITCLVRSYCGDSYSFSSYVHSLEAGVYHVVSNPVINTLILELEDATSIQTTTMNDDYVDIQLYSSTMLMRSTRVRASEKTVQMDVSRLQRGMYSLVVSKGGQVVQSEIIIIQN